MFLRTCPALILALSSCLASAQWPSQASTFTLRGTVVNSVTGEAIGGALVQINAGIQRSLLTGPDGKFVFDGMPEGPTSIAIRKPGFFNIESIPSPIPRPQPPVIVTADMHPVVLKLIPEGLIYGRISGSDGEPLEDFPVHLLAERVENGKTTQGEFGQNITTGEGEFRFADLPPGIYFLFVGPSPAPEPIPSAPTPQGYSISFYPGVPDLSAATAIEITPGKRAEINLAPSPQPFYRVSGTVSGYPPGEGVSLQVFSGAGPLSVGVSFDSLKGSFQTEPIPGGPCSITARAQDGKTQQSFSATRSVNLVSDLAGIHLTLLPGVTIPVNVHVEATRNDESRARTIGFSQLVAAGEQPQEVMPAQVMLSSGSGVVSRTQYSAAFIGNPGNRIFALQNIDPGSYTLQVAPNGVYYLHSASSGSVDLLRNELTVSPGGAVPPIEIVLRDDFANLSGKVRDADRNTPKAVFLIPEASMTGTRFESTSTDGSFSAGLLPPGAYKLLAFDPSGDLDFAKPEVLQKYLSRARDITLAPNQSAQIDLDLLRPGD